MDVDSGRSEHHDGLGRKTLLEDAKSNHQFRGMLIAVQGGEQVVWSRAMGEIHQCSFCPVVRGWMDGLYIPREGK